MCEQSIEQKQIKAGPAQKGRALKRGIVLSLMIAVVLSLTACKTGGSRADQTPAEQSAIGATTNVNAIREFEAAVEAFETSKGQDLATVQSHLERALKEDPRFGRAWFNLGVVHELRGNASDARDAYGKALSNSPRLGAAHVNLAMMALDDGDRARAWDMFQKALEVQNYNPEAHNNISVILRERGQYAEAVNHARRSLAGDSQNTGAYANLARIYYDRGNYEVAKLVMYNATQIDETNPDLHNILGLVALAQNDVTAAIAHFQRTLSLEPDHVPALLNMGAVILNVRDYERAQTFFEKVLEQKPEHIDAIMSIAVARRGLGDLEGAREYYGKVMNLDPDNAVVQFNLGVLEHEHMAQNAQMGANADDPPEDPIGQMDWNIANMKASIVHYEKALEHYRQYLYLDKSDEIEIRDMANERIGQVSQIIQMTNEQIPMMEQQKGDIRLAMEEEARWQAEQGAMADDSEGPDDDLDD